MRVAVVGGGIAGLAAAWQVVQAAPGSSVTVFEPGPLGGKIRTSDFGGRPVDEGPDAFLTRVPQAVALCDELGLTPELVAPAAGASMLWWRGRLRPLPEGLVLGVPRRLGPVVRSGLLSWRGVVRAAADVVAPRRHVSGDLSVRALVASRFGAEVADRLVDPLVGSIHAGRTDQLSAAATVPQLVAASAASRSLLKGLRQVGGGGGPEGPVFLTPRGGLSVLVDALSGRLAEAGVAVVTEGVRSVGAGPGGVVDVGGQAFDGCVLAVPASEAAALVAGSSADAAEGLRGIDYAGVALATLGFPADAAELPPGVNGILVPRAEGRLMTACSFGSSKWPHWAAPGTVVVRVSAGRHLDSRALDLDDDRLVGTLVDELSAALGAPLPAPTEARVSRWPAAFPQYTVGHLDRVAGIEGALARDLPGVALAGAGTRGAGIPACIGSGRAAADRVLAQAGARVR